MQIQLLVENMWAWKCAARVCEHVTRADHAPRIVAAVRSGKMSSASSRLTGSASAIACLHSAQSVTAFALSALCLSITKK